MKRLAIVAALASLAGATSALAQPTPPDYTPPSSSSAPAPSTSVPPLPSMDANQSAEVQRLLAPYRTQIDARVASGEIAPQEAGRLLQWRERQIARQVVGNAAPPRAAYDHAAPPGSPYDPPPQGTYNPPPQGAYDQAPPQGPYDQMPPPGAYAQAQPPVPYYPQPYYAPPYYGPYYAPPYYYGPTYYRPAPYYYGARICAGGWGHHVAGRICI